MPETRNSIGMHIVITGNPVTGLAFHGPFATLHEATGWAGRTHQGFDWWAAPLQSTDAITAQPAPAAQATPRNTDFIRTAFSLTDWAMLREQHATLDDMAFAANDMGNRDALHGISAWISHLRNVAERCGYPAYGEDEPEIDLDEPDPDDEFYCPACRAHVLPGHQCAGDEPDLDLDDEDEEDESEEDEQECPECGLLFGQHQVDCPLRPAYTAPDVTISEAGEWTIPEVPRG